jgi:hypothetical protein
MGIEDVLNELPVPEISESDTPEEGTEKDGPPPTEEARKAETKTEPATPLVPLEALREERERRREVQAQLQVLESRMEQILEAMQNQRQVEPEDKEEPVTYEEDPMGYLKRQIEVLNQQLGVTAKMAAEERRMAQFNEMRNSVAAAEQAFAAQTPDYWDSVKFLQQRRIDELEALGYNEQQIAITLGQDTANIVSAAYRQGKNPAQFVYEMAKKLGFTGNTIGAGYRAQGTASEPPSSLSGMGGSSTSESVPTAQEISKMSDAEFNRLFKKYFPG